MSYGVTPTGFVRPTLAELKATLDAKAQVIFPGLDVSGDGIYGQLAGLFLKYMADAWDALQECYTMLNRNEATGASLDNLLALTGVIRIDASPTVTYGGLLWGDNGTLVSANSIVAQSSTKKQAYLKDDVTISKSVARKALFTLADPSGTTTWTLLLDGVMYSYTGTVKNTAGASLVSAINAGALGTVASYANGVLTVDGSKGYYTASKNFSIGALTNITLDAFASAGTMIAVDEGPLAFPVDTVDTIITTVSGWDSVSNPLAGLTGRYAETDAELRARASTFFSSGKATDEAIRQYILNNVTGVIACSVISNRSKVVDSEGRPPNSFETLVEGGEDGDIANAIWATAPSGIEIYGDVSLDIPDSSGNLQTIRFTRPTYAYIWVKVKRGYNTEEAYPANGDTLIKEAIVAWALATFNSGENVYRRAIMTPVNGVPGLGDVSILLGNTTNGTTPTAYNASDIAIDSTALASFSVDRIIVEDI